ASQFKNDGWSIKKTIRAIVLSKTYRQQVKPLPPLDPDNRLLSSMNRKRLNFESMRDGFLQVSNELDLKMGGPSKQLHTQPYSLRRAIYGHIDRQNLAPTLTSFDFANPNIHSPKRVETTVPQQALFALNHPFVLARARELAKKARLLAPVGDPKRIDHLIPFFYQKILSRDPNPDEINIARSFLETDAKLANLEDFAQALLVSNEFFFVD
ncbi:MAG: DUF1553 domain-containing protein, partial [Opitutae bacterium]|nr:DUF1553 domain-containing protein [Opitutae bacterium]